MSRSSTYYGKIIVRLEDGSKKTVSVHKNGRSILLDDGGHPLGRISVHPTNVSSIDGWMREYKGSRPLLRVQDYEFIPAGQ